MSAILTRGEQRLLVALRAGPGEFVDLAARVKRTVSHTKAVVSSLRAAALVKVDNGGGGRGKRSQVTLTTAGVTLARALAGGARK